MNWEHLRPENFREFLSSITFLVGIIFSFISIARNTREHSLRMTGLFLLAGLALFANNPYCYFATLFIVATAVTQLEFLQNLAAIIRGSKEYFDYQKEYLSQREVEKGIERDVREIEAATPEPSEVPSQDLISISIDRANMTAVQFSLLVEQYTFSFLEKKYGRPIQKYVRFKGHRSFAEFDGVMQMDDYDLLFEIKSSMRGFIPIILIRDVARKYVDRAKEYQDITRRKASLRFVLIGNSTPAHIEKLLDLKSEISNEQPNTPVDFEVYSFEEIGLTDLQLEKRE